MPELPEVEIIRRGLCRHVTGRIIKSVDILDVRSVRYHTAPEFIRSLESKVLLGAQRRGKFLWFPLAEKCSQERSVPEWPANPAFLVHLGMSGQMLFSPGEAPDQKHLRVRLVFDDGVDELRFVDQRIFGYASLDTLQPDAFGTGRMIPEKASHIAMDPLEDAFDARRFVMALKSSKRGIKRLLLDQRVVSGIGNIYADEALWNAGIHYNVPANMLGMPQLMRLVEAVRDIMCRAIAAGGTSFDELYVDVNGSSGRFSRNLNAYGQEGKLCPRHVGGRRSAGAGTFIMRDSFMNRSSFYCPSCQKELRPET